MQAVAKPAHFRVAVMLAAAALVAGLIALVVASVVPDQTAFAREDGKIVFTNDDGLLTMKPHGSKPVRIEGQRGYPGHGGDQAGVSLSPDGSKIAYINFDHLDDRADIFVMSSDGSGQDVLITPGPRMLGVVGSLGDPAYPSWSPDGSKLVFGGATCCKEDGNYIPDLFVAPSDGSGQPTKLTDTADVDESMPSWSSIGKIAFAGKNSSNGSYDIYSMNSDGTERRNLTDTAEVNEWMPSWSPDGQRLAFSAFNCSGGVSCGKNDLFTMNHDGTGRTNLTNTESVDEQHPDWSPDGTQLVFTGYKGWDAPDPDSEIYKMNATGSAQINLTDNAVNEKDADWGPAQKSKGRNKNQGKQ